MIALEKSTKKQIVSLTLQNRQQGFTLVEVMVVMVVIGVLIGVATLSFGSVAQREHMAEGQRMQLVLQQCADRALYQQQSLGWFWDGEKYGVSELSTDNKWRPVTQKLMADYSMPEEFSIAVELPLPDTSTNAQRETSTPAITFLSSGEYQPLRIRLKNSSGQSLLIHGDGIGKVWLQEVDDVDK